MTSQLPNLAQAHAQALAGQGGSADFATYALAYMSSSLVEVLAVGVLISMVIFSVARRFLDSAPTTPRAGSIWTGVDPLKLYKLIIPLACLTLTGWVWMATQGA